MLLLPAGCSDDTSSPGHAGTITLTSQLYGSGPYYAMGYNFSLGKMVRTLDQPGPDLTVLARSTPDNSRVESAYLNTDNLHDSFVLNGAFPDRSTAEAFFDSYLEVDDSPGYRGIADSLAPWQVWTFRTSGNKFVKLLVLSVKTEIRDNFPYAETTLRFVYQPDGSRTFPQ